MTSREALDELYAGELADLPEIDLCKLPETKERKYLDDLYEAVKSDLDVLDILRQMAEVKKCKGYEKVYINCYAPEEKINKIKEWLSK